MPATSDAVPLLGKWSISPGREGIDLTPNDHFRDILQLHNVHGGVLRCVDDPHLELPSQKCGHARNVGMGTIHWFIWGRRVKLQTLFLTDKGHIFVLVALHLEDESTHPGHEHGLSTIAVLGTI